MSWFTRLFSTQPPELSCFVRGLIRSMKETPEKWERNHLYFIRATNWTYLSPYVSLWMPDVYRWTVHSVSRDFPKLTRVEKKALTTSLFEYLEKPYQAKILDARTIEQRKLMAPFEKMGCPDKP